MDVLDEIKAMIREKIKGQKKYQEIAEEVIDPALGDFFLKLKEEEQKQQKLLIAKMDNILEFLGDK